MRKRSNTRPVRTAKAPLPKQPRLVASDAIKSDTQIDVTTSLCPLPRGSSTDVSAKETSRPPANRSGASAPECEVQLFEDAYDDAHWGEREVIGDGGVVGDIAESPCVEDVDGTQLSDSEGEETPPITTDPLDSCNASQRNKLSREKSESSVASGFPSLGEGKRPTQTPQLPPPPPPTVDDNFSSLPLSEPTLRAISRVLNFTTMTPIQHSTIPLGLQGYDILGKAPTGSGKTIAYLVPGVELLHKNAFTQSRGVGVVILSPTRELTIQIACVAEQLVTYHGFTHTVIIGGANVDSERSALLRGANIVVSTAGRLIKNLVFGGGGFSLDAVLYLVVDEADLLLEIGHQPQLLEIISRLPPKRQSMLFSATMSQRVHALALLSLSNAVFVDVERDSENPTVSTIEHHFTVVSTAQRVDMLIAFLKATRGEQKVMVFFSTCNEVRYFGLVIRKMLGDSYKVIQLHSRLRQDLRTSLFLEFAACGVGILFTTDVAARGVDIPNVDWIVQFDLPRDTQDYIHRVGRCARAGKSGHALLLLQPHEKKVADSIAAMGVPISQLPVPPNLKPQYYVLARMHTHPHVKQLAILAMQDYVTAYNINTHGVNFQYVDVNTLARSYGLEVPPPTVVTMPPTEDIIKQYQQAMVAMQETRRVRSETPEERVKTVLAHMSAMAEEYELKKLSNPNFSVLLLGSNRTAKKKSEATDGRVERDNVSSSISAWTAHPADFQGWKSGERGSSTHTTTSARRINTPMPQPNLPTTPFKRRQKY
ncbi:ATP-dependent RNA helicase HAS1 [Pelomyxa schiedti]|nr:ATP-dependent RNA helicase HAS1 [Pelomyxa schiedti]